LEDNILCGAVECGECKQNEYQVFHSCTDFKFFASFYRCLGYDDDVKIVIGFNLAICFSAYVVNLRVHPYEYRERLSEKKKVP
jgi:hypothetical protein